MGVIRVSIRLQFSSIGKTHLLLSTDGVIQREDDDEAFFR